ncbi:hypothetical protein Hypma_008113 [Hypsizygus marmoreus]|uniref:Uncharacterized protein n=1 Tax=Hypsizygus marmoreus TaxID=39966 RepID=A0A369JUI4_HYPMA|nr:hypothetical protein Hypma_008113 [Hypsizygus marmoreus]
MATWLASNPVQHPWFTKPSMKRKLSESPSPISSASQSSSSSPSGSPPPHKRRKHSALEAGFSNLSLVNSHPTDTSGSSSALNYASEHISTLSASYSSIEALEPSIEEPTVPEVKMKSSSWYEPERDRIVVTDLDSSSDEDDENADPDTASISISRALLRQISSRNATKPILLPPSQSQALVLFKPLPTAGVTAIVEEPEDQLEEGKADDTGSISIDVLEDMVADEDAMDIEPW